ncbi:oligoendopeptidase F [Ammoniphilus sp. CFH 90114]|uniref:oligoendopeptidase F n=1 Tax=Ammoniphilus sp. CFH 90114 TaxID=2493665 RepID=UPI00100E82B8|nr:oligoendopeptidase F [Ammoniphilus sp. CFH 90114]RXT08134.1 oligoendopeptidase F [Ammoniphilus sp. CFH 90114]
MEQVPKRKLPVREEIDSSFKWILEDIYQNDGEWEAEFSQVKEQLPGLAKYKGKLGESPQELLQCLKLKSEISLLMERLFVYARMRRDENNTNGKYQALTDRASSLSVQVGSASSFIVPEILSIPEEHLIGFLKEEKELALYDFYLKELLRQKSHVLSAEQEELLAQAGELAGAPGNIFRMLNNADLKFPKIKDEDGDEVELTHGRYIQFMESPDRRVREEAFKAMYDTYRKNKNTFAATLNSSVKKDVFYSRVRKYESALKSSLDDDNIPVEVYDNLIQTVRSNLPVFYRYVDLRKKMLELDELHMYDIYVPMVKEVEMKMGYKQAYETMMKGLAPLGEEYASLLREARDHRWIDVYENEGKTSGAYSWGAYGTHPYVLLNYQDTVDNMFTLAHEMGHALHSYYSDKEQPYLYAQYTIFVAEVASTVNESLLMDWMLKNTTDKKEKMFLLNHYLEQFRGTVFRQTMFAEFEKMTHEKVEKGEALTPETLSSMYYQLNKDYYGEQVHIDQDIEMEWSRIPHFYNAFYVYKYATGFSAATALSQQILQEGEPAVERYLNFLKSGGSNYPLELLKSAGVDMTTPEPIQSALDVFRRLLDELESLVNEA